MEEDNSNFIVEVEEDNSNFIVKEEDKINLVKNFDEIQEEGDNSN